MVDKISEIKFINDNNDILISKIEITNNKFNTIINEISIDLKDFIVQFTESLNDNIKSIESKFNKQNEELEKLKKELENKSFDDKNYMNVSITMNLAKQIKERDLKIKELEQRIKFIENKKITEVISDVIIPKEVIPVEIIPEEVIHEEVIHEEVIPEEVIPEVTKSKSKKISLKNKKEDNIESLDKPPKKNTKKPIKNEIEESKSVDSSKSVEESKSVDESKSADESKSVDVEEEIVLVDDKKKSKKKSDSNKKKKTEIVDSKVDSKEDEKKEIIDVKYPEIIADINDIDIFELNNVDYFMDKKNNVYQITEDQDIGIFLGVYDKTNNQIIYMK
jgi:hypothetical protein